MRGKTRNLLENFLAFLFLVFVIVILFFIVANYTSLGKSLELESLKEEVLSNIKEDKKIEENIVVQEDNNTQEMEENIISEDEKNISNNEPLKNNNIQKEEVTKVNTQEKIQKEEVKKQVIQKKIEPVKKEESKKVEVKKVAPQTQAQEVQKEKKKKGPVLSAKNLAKFNIINKFIRDTKSKINANIMALNIPKTESSRYANIRVTVLSDGGYEQLKLMDGNKEYFDLINDAIVNAFPISIDERITDQFPRYFRMKIIEGK